MPRLRALYRDTVAPALIEEFSYDSAMQVPRLTKILLSMGVGMAPTNRQLLDTAVNELTLIAGQRAVTTRARRSIAAFKIRAGMEIGAMVTLRGDRMLEFLDRFVNVAVPRIKDFRGLSPNSFDGRGNYSVGVDEQIIFSEIDYDRIDSIHGLNVTIVTSAHTDREGRSLLAGLGMPFRSE
ncbi:MAG: 50S ribosomal protein L5 [Spirochaetaceae bacterium]|nr:50S ribosomal protein L5 [Spirochaetaceae bacterium]MDE0221555.1 50S ribosomal protein L5 [Spirochaetaceae bacterium]